MLVTPPPPGLCLPCSVRVVYSPDHYLIDLDGGCEIELFAIGVVPNEESESLRMLAVSQIHDLLSATADVTAWIPQPNFDRGWVRNIKPQSRHAGMLFFDTVRLTHVLRNFWPVEDEDEERKAA